MISAGFVASKGSKGMQLSSDTTCETGETDLCETGATVCVDCHLNELWNDLVGFLSAEAAEYWSLKLSQGNNRCPDAAGTS